MTHPVQGVDHIFLLVHDLEAAAAAYRRLGFTLSPRGTHSAAKGTANYTFVFDHDYAELLGVIADTPANQHQRDMLSNDGEGLRAIACRIGNAHEAREALTALGIATEPVSEFSRPLPLPDGSEGVAAFAVTSFAPEVTPKGFLFMCEHKTPEMVWRPELRDHANGANGLGAIIAVASDTEDTAEGFARLYAAGHVSAIPGGHLVETGKDSAVILVLTPEAAASRYSSDAIAATPRQGFAALRFKVADLARARSLLIENGIAAHPGADGSIWVAPAFGAGSIVEFVQG